LTRRKGRIVTGSKYSIYAIEKNSEVVVEKGLNFANVACESWQDLLLCVTAHVHLFSGLPMLHFPLR
jgi:hypothetical protein